MSSKADEVQPIIVKKIKKGGGGHHGGAWKVAYADFVTAMMAFFLLMWLLNVTTEENRNAISAHFDPTPVKVSVSTSGAGGVMGGLSMSTEGAMAEDKQPLTAPEPTGAIDIGKKVTAKQAALEKLEQELRQKEDESFKDAEEKMIAMLDQNKKLRDLAKNLMMDLTPEGLRLQLIEQEGDPLFEPGTAIMLDKMRQLLGLIAEVIVDMPNEISVRGHTDSTPPAEIDQPSSEDDTQTEAETAAPETEDVPLAETAGIYSNWELSADRANASRAVLVSDNIPADQFANVMGKADREPLVPEDPFNANNRRITLLLLREPIEKAIQRGAFGQVGPEEKEENDIHEPDLDVYDPYLDYDADVKIDLDLPEGDMDKPYEKTPGAVYFP